jgi:hypothetical protein
LNLIIIFMLVFGVPLILLSLNFRKYKPRDVTVMCRIQLHTCCDLLVIFSSH